jgi:hypothetical protein
MKIIAVIKLIWLAHHSNNVMKQLSIAAVALAILMVLSVSLISFNNNAFGQNVNQSSPSSPSSPSNITTTTTTPTTTPTAADKTGTVASVQNGPDGKPAWNLEGEWNSTGLNSNNAVFNAQFSMAKLDGSSKHTHTISNFKIVGNPVNSTSGTTYNGTATISMKEGPVDNVPVTIVLSSNGVFSVMVDPKTTSDHFGNTPIKGKSS